MLKLDPVDAFYSVGSSLIGRCLLFFSSGMVGLALGWVAEGFEDWEDFLHPMEALENTMAGSPGEFLMWLALWPVVSIGTMANPCFCGVDLHRGACPIVVVGYGGFDLSYTGDE